MIKTFIRDGKMFASIEDLFRWNKNPKIVLKDDFERLKKHITRFGQFKPLVVIPSGEVIGGNSRLEAMRDLNIKDVWISLVEPKSETEKVEIALADNDEVGKYIEEELAELVSSIPDDEINLKDYKVNIGKDIDLKALLDSLGPSEGTEEAKEEDEAEEELNPQNITCPECGHKFSILKEKNGERS